MLWNMIPTCFSGKSRARDSSQSCSGPGCCHRWVLRASGIHQKVRTMPASRSICWSTAIFTFARPRVRRCELLLNTHPQAASGTADACRQPWLVRRSRPAVRDRLRCRRSRSVNHTTAQLFRGGVLGIRVISIRNADDFESSFFVGARYASSTIPPAPIMPMQWCKHCGNSGL
jgi:hypothetical protein